MSSLNSPICNLFSQYVCNNSNYLGFISIHTLTTHINLNSASSFAPQPRLISQLIKYYMSQYTTTSMFTFSHLIEFHYDETNKCYMVQSEKGHADILAAIYLSTKYKVDIVLPVGILVINPFNHESHYYMTKLREYSKLVNISESVITRTPQLENRYLGYLYTNEIRAHQIPFTILPKSYCEAVLIECRQLPNLEFVLRNTIHKLGNSWAHTIVCGLDNHSFIQSIIADISTNIRIICLPVHNMNVDEYTNLLTTIPFWSQFNGEKLLIYQEDSWIFHGRINEFLHFDYIGAPWIQSSQVNPQCVGNGGFSLRSKSIIIDALKAAISYPHKYNTFVPSSHVVAQMQRSNLQEIPEDVVITNIMGLYNIGIIADATTASRFSTESIWNPNSLGGHKIWCNNPNWKKRVYNDILLTYTTSALVSDNDILAKSSSED